MRGTRRRSLVPCHLRPVSGTKLQDVDAKGIHQAFIDRHTACGHGEGHTDSFVDCLLRMGIAKVKDAAAEGNSHGQHGETGQEPCQASHQYACWPTVRPSNHWKEVSPDSWAVVVVSTFSRIFTASTPYIW